MRSLAVIVVLSAVATFAFVVFTRSRYTMKTDGGLDGIRARSTARVSALVTAVCSIAALAMLVASVIVIVPMSRVGVVSRFGTPRDVVGSGWHVKAPWNDLSIMDAAVQTDQYVGKASCITVRIARQGSACVDVTIAWRIHPDAADSLLKNYRSLDEVRTDLVKRQLASSISAKFASYDALSLDGNHTPTAPTLVSIARTVSSDMREQIGDQVEVLSVFIPNITLDDRTQAKASDAMAAAH